jgi:hypothetical protein
MPISRAAFQIKIPGSIEIGARQVAHALKDLPSATQQSGQANQRIDVSTEDRHGASNSNADVDQRADENSPESHPQTLPNLPPAEAPSAGTQDAIGPTQPQTEARRSVATGRDAPQTPPVPQDREINELDGGHVRAQTQVIERRLQGQKSATAEHLTGIHTIVERLLDLTETHFLDGGQKLQSLEHKLARLEMRYSLNRSLP